MIKKEHIINIDLSNKKKAIDDYYSHIDDIQPHTPVITDSIINKTNSNYSISREPICQAAVRFDDDTIVSDDFDIFMKPFYSHMDNFQANSPVVTESIINNTNLNYSSPKEPICQSADILPSFREIVYDTTVFSNDHIVVQNDNGSV